MGDFFPLDVNQKLGEIIRDKIPSEINIPKGKIKISHKHIEIDRLEFTEDRIIGKTTISNLSVGVQHL